MKVQSRVAALGAALATTTLFAAPALASAPLLECPGGGYGDSLISLVQGGLDDGSASVSIAGVFPNGMDVLGVRFTDAWVNINGTITFEDPLAAYTPDAIPGLSQPTIAPYFADVDFRVPIISIPPRERQGDMTFCEDPANNRVLITWKDVGYYNKKIDKLNSFQVVLKNTEGECADAETFDVEFRYNRLEWTTGDANDSGGSGGLGGHPAVAGIDAGDELSAQALPGSGTAAVLDLVNQTNTGTPGVFEFRVAGWTMPSCGDGVIDTCEECDGGAGCTPICTVSMCGDGFVEPGVEQCDGEAFAGGAASCPAGYTGTPLCNNDPNNALADGTCTVDAVPAGCVDVDECAETTGICGDASCVNTDGGYSCVCPAGYEFNGTTCVDVDECTETPGVCGAGTCSNTGGDYSCACDAGYEFDGTTCVDVDECADTTTCGAGTCTNTDGGYSCGCPEGYVSNNGTCENVDECTENAGVCGAGTCTDTDGAYECACEEGYEFANGTCENVDECAQSTDTCSENATCTDTDGAYECGCEPGYAGNGEVCTVVVTIISPDTSLPVGTPTPTFEGTGEPGAVVELSVDGEVVGTATVDPDGEWTIVLDEPLEDGEYSVVVGDGSSTDEVTLVIDTLAPELEVTLPEQDVRYSNSPDAIEGQAEPGNQIDIVINGEHVGTTTADENGEFEFELDEALEDGVYEVIVSATDDAGNTTDEIVDFSVDGSAELQIETPEDESTVRTSTPTISGTAEPGTIVVVLIDGEEVAQVEADEEGEWTYTLEEALEDGEYDVVVQADSPSGTRQDQVEITVDTTTTDVTIVKPGTDVPTSEATPEFSGNAAPGATVTIIIDGEEVAEVEADSNGQWSYVPEDDLSEGEHTVTVISEDEGVETEATVDFEVDLTPPTLEVTSPKGDSDWFGEPVVVEGEAEPGSVVVIEVDGEVVETIEVGEDGQWSTTLPGDLGEGEHVVTVRAEDPAGNTTEEQRTFSVTYGELAGGSVFAGCASAPGSGGNGLWLVLAALGMVISRRRRR
ncbi:Ig-like domain-containing protein [Lujinxingia litoralis]|nr:Ig-like domain-containing protein [Lujinxingia litoralis]